MEPKTPCICITTHDRMGCVGWCKVLTAEEALENRIRSDCRNIDSLRPDTSRSTLACLVADCAVHWKGSLEFPRLRALAEENLSRVAEIWENRKF